MKITFKWLKEYLETDASCEMICEKLTQIGLEVEDITDTASNLKGFDCVLVENTTKHPESDHLNVCTVKTATGKTLQIVCGAPNVKSGVKAVLANVGSIIPSTKTELKKSKIRGKESQGMLCSEKELCLGDDHDGILLLPNDTPLGKNIAEIKNMDDVLIDIYVTPNRGDCLGIYGIARSLSSTGIGNLKKIEEFTLKETIKNKFEVSIESEYCDEFAIRYIKNVNNCESPEWLKEKLSSVGFTPKSALVDITNYVMWIINRPMHCYDANTINGNFIVKNSIGNEKFCAIDRNEYILPPNTILITDDSDKIMGLGGIMGGLDTATKMQTTDIVLECAVFDSINIAQTTRKISLNSDAKYRFERGVDYATTELALNYATKLVVEICGGEVSEIVKQTNKKVEKKNIEFIFQDIKDVLGIEIPQPNVIEILTKLGYEVQNDTNKIKVKVPTWRNDVSIKENVIEDIIKIYGYDNLEPLEIVKDKIGEDEVNVYNKLISDKYWEVNKLLAGNGMTEIISYTFINENLASEFTTLNSNLKIINPITIDMAYMRPTIIPSMLNIIKYNIDRGIDNVSIFENGMVFSGTETQNQKRVLSGIRYGLTTDKDIFKTSRNYDIYDIKKDLFDVLELFNINAENLIITNDFPNYYHPTKSGAIKMGNLIIGVFGEIHPLKVRKFDIKGKVNAFELYLNIIPKLKQKSTQKKKFILNELQPIYRDFAFIVDKNIEFGKIVSMVKKVEKELIKEVNLFDVYQGNGIDNNKKSIAFSVKIYPILKSLTTEEIDIISDKIIKEISDKVGGQLRDK
jgi:phenylalanyl-tRNA synthetase beta chain